MGRPKDRGVVSEITGRQAARDKGWGRYFTGKPCRNGHIAERLVSNGTCLDCQLATTARGRARDPDRFKRYSVETGRRFAEANPDYGRLQYQRHAHKTNPRSRAWAIANPEKRRTIRKRWKRNNTEWAAGWARKRRQALRQRTPRWLTPEQMDEIDAFYVEAASRPGGPWQVDHIVPLNGRTVCGLHVPWNLQIISASDNASKGNRLIEELLAAA